MSLPTLNLTNQYGETSENVVVGGDAAQAYPVAAVAATDPAAAANAVTIALSTSNTYTDAAVNTAVNAALVTVIADINALKDAINALRTALLSDT